MSEPPTPPPAPGEPDPATQPAPPPATPPPAEPPAFAPPPPPPTPAPPATEAVPPPPPPPTGAPYAPVEPPPPGQPVPSPAYGPGYGPPPPAYGDPYAAPAPGAPVPPGAPYAYYGAPVEPVKPGRDGFAIAALVFGIIGGILLAVIFAIVALTRIRKSGRKGKGMAIAALVLSGIWVAALAVLVPIALSQADRSSTGEIVGDGKISANDLRVGDCIKLPDEDDAEVTTFDGVPCSKPHGGEVYAVGTVSLTGDWPGDTAVRAAAEEVCAKAFQPFIGKSIEQSSLDLFYVYPTEGQWKGGDRTVTCVVSGGASTTGSLKGSAK